jgi:hypothetical protein
MKPIKAAIGLIEKSLGALTLADNITMVLRKRAG